MDMRSWKKVLLQWITECGFMERNYFNIEQSDIDAFYQNYSLQHHKTATGKYKHLGEFLKEFYPSFDINFDDDNCLSSADYIYVYSLLLHFCCVKHPETVFHEICQKLPDYSQQFIASFFKELLDTEHITKENLRHAIAEVANNQSPPPRLNESFTGHSVNSSLGNLSTASFPRSESPLKTPKRSAGPQRISPSTPKSYLLEERTRELYNLRALLETERYEKGLLEVQIIQNEDKIQKLNYDHRRLLQQIQDLKNDIIVKTSDDGSSNRDGEENQVQKRLLKELTEREQELFKLSDISRTLREEKSLVEEKLKFSEKQIVVCMSRIKELELKVYELVEEMEKKNEAIEYLTNSKMELEQFINETRSSGNPRPDLNASMDCLDNSYVRNSGCNNTNSSASLSSPENLGTSVVDVQLREKEHENQILKEELINVKREHKRLANQLIKITQEFERPIANANEDIFETGAAEEQEDEDNEKVLKVSSKEQFNIFNNCMEKIIKFHKTEKTKVKQLEEITQDLQQENEELQKKLETLNEQVKELNEKVVIKEKQQEELLNTKKQVDATLEQCQQNVEHLQQEKQKLYTNLQSLESKKNSLNNQLEELSAKLALEQKNAKELFKNYNDLKDQELTAQTQLQNIQLKFNTKTSELENKIQKLTEKVNEQVEEIKVYQQSEETLKKKYEQVLIQNDTLQKQAREADTHLNGIKQELREKEKQMLSLGEEISDFTLKNKTLEENIKLLMDEYKQEKSTIDDQKSKQQNYVQELEKQIENLKDKLSKEELLLESKQHECDLKKQQLEKVKPQIENILKLFENCPIKSNIFFNLSDLESQIISLLEVNKKITRTQFESLNKLEDLKLQLKEKSEQLERQNDCLNNSSYKIEELEKELTEKTEKLKQNLDALEKSCKKVEDLEKELKEKTETLKQISNSLEMSSKEIEKLEKELKEKTETLKQNSYSLEISSKEIEKLEKELKEKNDSLKELSEMRQQNLEYEEQIEQFKAKQLNFMEKVKKELTQKELELQESLQEAALEYDLSLERIGQELKLEKEQHNNIEIELLLLKAEHNEIKKQLAEAKTEIQKLQECSQEKQEKLQYYETKIQKCTEENDHLRLEIETFKEEVTQNALRLLEADKALNEYIDLTKQQDSHQIEMENLKKSLQDKEVNTKELEKQLKQQIEQFKQDIEEKSHEITTLQENIVKLSNDKEKLLKEAADSTEQIQREQQDKIVLLNSLESSTDQLKLLQEEKEQQKLSIEQKYLDIKQQFDQLTLQNTKLQGDLVERKAELQQSIDELQQERKEFQQKLCQIEQQMAEKSGQLETLDMTLMEVITIMENNFNLSLEINEEQVKNLFNYQKLEENEENNFQKLRLYLNKLLYSQQQLQQELKEISEQKQQAVHEKNANMVLQKKLQQKEKLVQELKEQLENEDFIMEKRISQEVKRLEGDLLNLEKVNERLTHENVKIQVSLDNAQKEFKNSKIHNEKLDEEKLQLQEDLRSKTLVLEKLQQTEKKLQQSFKEKCQYAEKVSEKSKQLENQYKEKSIKLQNLEKDYQDLKEKSLKCQQKLTHYQTQQQTLQSEHKKLQEKLKSLQTANESLELDVTNKNKEHLTMKNKNLEISQQLKEKEQQLLITSQKLDEMLSYKLNGETKCEQLLSETYQLKRDLEFLKSQQQTQQDESLRLNQEIESLKIDKQHLRDEIRETKLSLQRANDNVSQLIQQISSIRLEKESALEENQLLRKQLEETGKNQSTSESKLKTIIEKSQDFERKLLTSENELKFLKVQLDKSEINSAKLLTENKKLRDSQEVSTKRIEKLALKLGDAQAKSAKLERDNEKLSKTFEAHAATVEALQKEKDLLQTEAKSLKERLSRAERGHEQLSTKVQNLEHLNASLQQMKEKLEASEIDGKIKLNKLEKMREANEEKIRKLTSALSSSENLNVKLNLEIGALNSELQKSSKEHNQEQLHQHEELKQKLEQSQDLTHKYEEINEKLKLEVYQLKEENSSLNDQLSKVSLSLDITKQRCDKLASEMEQIRADLLIIRQEKSQVELQHETSIQKLSQFETQNTKLIYERKNLVTSLEQRISSLEEELALKSKEVDELQKEIVILKDNSESNSSLLQQTTSVSLLEVEQLRSKLFLATETIETEQKLIAQLRSDNQILHKKYQEAKQRALDAATNSEERIKENRLELEGKLEKMKNKMKTLYTEEITKMKTKQEREVAILKSEMEVIKTQNIKYEEHTRKLSNQIVRLNDNILEHQKENAMLSTKLKHLTEQQHHESERFKRPSSIHVSSISSSSAPVSASNNIGTNLAMEDEEGEVFNNTYLTDLKNGRMSELMSRDVCVEELQYRNSLLPPHLRSAYAAQFDHEFNEDDLKDGPHSLDDSMSALLSTTAGGTRKKCSGVTHYKRPGPPTPSKNGGGRLSFGGSSEPCREILKESYDTNAGSSAVSSSKTPARFTFFASRFSMGNTRDEKPSLKQEPVKKPLMIKQESDELNLRKVLQKQNVIGNRKLLNVVGCTSTPRKSKVHYDQRRLIDQLMTSSPSPSPLSIEHKHIKITKKITPPDVSIIETPVTALNRGEFLKAPIQHKSNAKRMVAIAGGLRRNRRNSSMYGRRLSRRMQEICTPTSGETTSPAVITPKMANIKTQKVICITQTTTSGSAGKTALLQRRLRKRPKREKGARPSLHLRGNIFAKYRTPNKGAIHDLNRYKSKKQRLEHFNQGRNIKFQEENDKTLSTKAQKDRTFYLKNNNYATFNQNKFDETVVVSKCQAKIKRLEQETFTFAEEVFETQDIEELDYMEDYESDEDFENDEAEEEDDYDEIYYGKDNDMKYDFPIKKECFQQEELITTQDLEEFDRFVEKTKQIKAEKDEINEESYTSNGSSQQFEKLLIETESNAPFEIKHINFDLTKSSHSSRGQSYQSSSLNHTHPSINSTSPQQDHHNISTATPHHSPTCSNPLSAHLSRTIYGGTVIYNHRLPNINTTYVRKSSIYIKNRNKSSNHLHHMDSSSFNDVVLITNQTITLVDLMRMWSQMDSSTRIIVCFAALASLTTLLGLCVSFCAKR